MHVNVCGVWRVVPCGVGRSLIISLSKDNYLLFKVGPFSLWTAFKTMMLSSVSGKDGTILWRGQMGQEMQKNFPYPVPLPIKSVSVSTSAPDSSYASRPSVTVAWLLAEPSPPDCHQAAPCVEVRVQLFEKDCMALPLTFADAPAVQGTMTLDVTGVKVDGKQLVVGA